MINYAVTTNGIKKRSPLVLDSEPRKSIEEGLTENK